MCGFCGVMLTGPRPDGDGWPEAIARSTRLLEKRGPDDEGFWADPERCYLGFRRLAVLDLSPNGRQPMTSASGGSVLVFNGEVYNFQELGKELESKGLALRSRSDTEVVLEMLERMGTEAMARFNGMFALAWYHRRGRRLLLARDHAGIKPLYYRTGPGGCGVLFGSQWNCLLQCPWGAPGGLRQDALRLYLQLHYFPAPYTLHPDIHQVEPGHWLVVEGDGTLRKGCWWKLPEEPEPRLKNGEAVEAVESAIANAVRRQRIADVPLGVFLSGGVDSPLVAAVARKQTGPELKAFTIGNPGWEQDESADASRYAHHLDVDHRLRPITGEQALELLGEVHQAQTEPFADYSIVPALLVSRVSRPEITVALSGDGGDELFFGYTRPFSLLRNGGDFRWPWLVRAALYAAGKYGLGPERSDVIVSKSPGDYYFQVNCRIRDHDLERIAPGLPKVPEDFHLYRFASPYRDKRQLANFSRHVEYYGQLQRCLKKVDMASMHCSLEVRVPLLDREVIETSLAVDPMYIMRNGTRKSVLRAILGRHVPASIIPEAKRGFSVPLGQWLRGPLKPIAEDLLFGPGSMLREPPFDPVGIRGYWNEHVSGRRDLKWGLWTLLSLESWRRTHNS
jgi:asparagine synthase (glutamine-hydrolysing)